MRNLALTLVVAAVCLCGCAAPAAPQPPSLGIPKAIGDLRAARKGDNVTLTWTEPSETIDGELVRKTGKMVVTRRDRLGVTYTTVTELPLEAAARDRQRVRASATDNIGSLISDPDASEFIFYRVSSVSSRGRTSYPSNQVSVANVATPPAPPAPTLKIVPSGIRITVEPHWPQPSGRLNADFVYRVRRRQSEADAATEPVTVAEIKPGESPVVIDTRIEWEKKFDYFVTPVTLWHSGVVSGETEGDDSPVAAIVAHDVFPPAAPAGLQAVFSGLIDHPAIDLTWSPNTEEDLAGYNIYRRKPGEPPVKLNQQLIPSPSFHDAAVTLGGTYYYAVSAVDLRGNESARSAETSETVPKE